MQKFSLAHCSLVEQVLDCDYDLYVLSISFMFSQYVMPEYQPCSNGIFWNIASALEKSGDSLDPSQ